MARISALDGAWESLFDRLGLLSRIREEGVVRLTGAELGDAADPRLMGELERSGQLPALLRRSGMSLLPLGPEEWAVGLLDTHRCVSCADARPRPVPETGLVSLERDRLYSTDTLLRFCLCGGIFDKLLGGRAYPTAAGAMPSGRFSFRVRSTAAPGQAYSLCADRAPSGIDCVLESRDALCLCAARGTAAEALPICRLYYPYRTWRARTDKPVIPVFLVRSGDLLHLFRYAFPDEGDLSSLSLVSHTAYTFADESITVAHVRQLWQSTRPAPEPDLPFPQADTFPRLIDLLGALWEGPLERAQIPLRCEIDARQADYYIHAAQYLGLADCVAGVPGAPLCLTDEGRRILGLPWRARCLALIACIFRRPVFHRAFGRALQLGDAPNRELVIRLMLECGLPLNETTLARRASTVRGWVSWILAQCGEGAQLSLL